MIVNLYFCPNIIFLDTLSPSDHKVHAPIIMHTKGRIEAIYDIGHMQTYVQACWTVSTCKATEASL